MKFSERIGVIPVNTVLQIKSMSDSLHKLLWNALHQFIWSQNDFFPAGYKNQNIGITRRFGYELGVNYFKKPTHLRFLDEELSSYRFMESQFVPITNEKENGIAYLKNIYLVPEDINE